MAESAVLEKEVVPVTAEQTTVEYPKLLLNGELVQTEPGSSVVFFVDRSLPGKNESKIDEIGVLVGAFPQPIDPKFRTRALMRFSGDTNTTYDIVTGMVTLNGVAKPEYCGIMYNDAARELVFVVKAQDKWGSRTISSVVQFRTKGANSIEGATRKVVNLEYSAPSPSSD